MAPRLRFESLRPALMLLLVVGPCIAFVDLAVEIGFPYLLQYVPLEVALVVDPLISLLLILPLLLWFVVRPMGRQIALREEAESNLREFANLLEEKVAEQTAELRTEIDDRERVEESLRLFRSLMDKSQDGIMIIDPPTASVLDANETSFRNLGYTRQELLSLKVWDFDPLVDSPIYADIVAKLSHSGTARFETVHKRKDSTTFPIEITLSYVLHDRGYIVAIVRDITQRRRVEEEQKRLQMAIEYAAEGVMITDTEGIITYVNPAFEQITGYNRDEAVGNNPRFLKSGKQDESFYKDLWQKIAAGDVWRGNVTNKRKDGSLYSEEATISPVRDTHGNINAFVAIKRDITRQLDLEAQLRQSQKMEAIGVLAAGIAHDFNNILAAVLGYTQLAMLAEGKNSEITGHLEQVEKASLRARDLVQHILTFSRQTESVLRPLKLDVVLDEVLKLLRASLPRTIDFRSRVEPLDHPVLADSSQIHQIVMNLCTNAAHAMREEGGVLEVSLAEFVVDEHTEKAGLELSRGAWARISVSDTGHGIDDATMEHIFEPFFTTKQDDGGTGLGLSTVHGIVKQHAGTITVYSEPGHGTIFHVYLPLARNADVESYQVGALVASGKGQRILVVDDEEPVALMLSQMLEKLHYSVTICANGSDALDTFRADPDRYDLILTDHAMPRMDGQQLVKEVKRIRPHLPIIMATGFDAKIDATDLGIGDVLLKPVLFDTLAFAVQSALESKSENATPSDPDLSEKGS